MDQKLCECLIKRYNEEFTKLGGWIRVGAVTPGNDALFRWKSGKLIRAWIAIQVDDESPVDFKIVCYWSSSSEDPFELMPIMCPRDDADYGIDRDDTINGTFAFDVASLWKPRTGQTWTVGNGTFNAEGNSIFSSSDETNMANVNGVVELSVKLIKEHLIPYLNDVEAELAT